MFLYDHYSLAVSDAQSPVVSQSLQQILPMLEKIVENCTSSSNGPLTQDKLASYFSRLSGSLSAVSVEIARTEDSSMSGGLSLCSPGLTGGEVEVSVCVHTGVH